MAINLNGGAAQAAVDGVRNAEQNKNKAADGFEDGMSFDDLLADYNEQNFGGSSEGSGEGTGLGDGGLGGASGGLGQNIMGPIALGGAPAAGGMGLGGGMDGLNIAGQLGQNTMGAQPEPKKPTITDVISDGSVVAAKATANILVSIAKSAKGLTLDDFVSLCMDAMICGGVLFLIGIICMLSSMSGNMVLKAFGRLFLPSGAVNIGASLIGVGLSYLGLLSKGEPRETVQDMGETPCALNSQPVSMDSLDAEYDALLSSFDDEDFGDDDLGDDMGMDDDFFSSGSSSSNFDDDLFAESTPIEPEPLSNEDTLNALSDTVARIDRQYLLDNFGKLLPRSCMTFGQSSVIDKDSDEFITVRSLLLQALSNVSKIPIEELPCDLEKLEATTFSYTMTVGRIKGVTRLQDIANEIEVYFREDANDTGVICAVDIEHGYYKISLTKGTTEMVTIRDCLEQPKVKKFFEDKKSLLPFIAGIDTYGEVILADGKDYSASLIAGKQRSGKSWFLTSIIITMATFNTPTDVQFLFIDPKKSSLYRTFSCLPHTIGVHDDEDIVGLLRYIIDVEGERRKAALRSANKGYGVDSIKDYRKEGNSDMPYLYIVIDEFLTAVANAEAKGQKKEFNALINMIITQLPFVGIHLIIVPHRAQGAVEKTARANIMMTAALRADNEIVNEVLDTKNWTRRLLKPGDMAIKLQDIGKEQFARAAVLTQSDEDNTTVIRDIAKAWYKIGADVPNIKYGMLDNKDYDYISAMLGLDNEQTRTLKLSAVGHTAESAQVNLSGALGGLSSETSFATEHRQNNNGLGDILDLSGIDFDTSSSTPTETESNDTLSEEDEDMMKRWRQQLGEDDGDDDEPLDTTGWEDESTIFDD